MAERSGTIHDIFFRYSRDRGNHLFADIIPTLRPDVFNDQLQSADLEARFVNRETGIGLFARNGFRNGQAVFTFDGQAYTENSTNGKYQNQRDAVIGPQCAVVVGTEGWQSGIEGGNSIYMDPDQQSPLRYLNHSCEPNVCLPQEHFKLAFMATRAIDEGEQITADYSFLETNSEWQMSCNCGSPNCRKVIRSIQHLSTEYVAKKWEEIPDYMRWIYLSQAQDPRLREYLNKKGFRVALNDFGKDFERID